VRRWSHARCEVSPEQRAKAVRLVVEAAPQHGLQWAAIESEHAAVEPICAVLTERHLKIAPATY
jgi:hypothetical protein